MVAGGVYWSSSTVIASTGHGDVAQVGVEVRREHAVACGVAPVADHAPRLPAAESPSGPHSEDGAGGGDALGVAPHGGPMASVGAPIRQADRDQHEPVGRAIVDRHREPVGAPVDHSSHARYITRQ